MKKFVTLSFISTALLLSACASNEAATDYSYESQAPYAADRTAGTSLRSGDAVFRSQQNK